MVEGGVACVQVFFIRAGQNWGNRDFYPRVGADIDAPEAWDLNTGNSEIIVAVADTGIGIAPDQQEHIFDEFYRVHDTSTADITGTGMGLPTARRIVEELDGSLSVVGEKGKDTMFTIQLPIEADS